jgi:P27 family predicted phage terminase small subunit
MKGRKPKPHSKKVAEGRHPSTFSPIVETTAVIHVPPYPLPPYALQRFNELKDTASWLRDIDSYLLADFCVCEFRILQCEQDIERRGLQVKTRRGLVANPYSRHLRHYRQQLNRLASELGLSPSSRERISGTDAASQPGAPDRIEQVMSGELVWDERIRDYVPAGTSPAPRGRLKSNPDAIFSKDEGGKSNA